MDDVFDEFGNPVEDFEQSKVSDDILEIQKPVNNTKDIIESNQDGHLDDSDIELVDASNAEILNSGSLVGVPCRTPQVASDPHSHRRVDPYLLELLKIPERMRNICILGPLHSGKSSLLDILYVQGLVNEPKIRTFDQVGSLYSDRLRQERLRRISLKSNGFTFLGLNFEGNSYAINALDVPGHTNFTDELATSLVATESVLICIDAIEGVTEHARKLIDLAQKNGHNIAFLINKIDRLVLELRIPVEDAYLKLVTIVNDLNKYTAETYSPDLGNIIFASTKLGMSFTIAEFVELHYSKQLSKKQRIEFTKMLWGNFYFNEGTFVNKPCKTGQQNAFAEFILTPFYKIITNTLTKEHEDLARMLLAQFQFELPDTCKDMDPEPLLKYVMSSLLGNHKGLLHAMTELQSPLKARDGKISKLMINKTLNEESRLLAHSIRNLDIGGQTYSLVRIYQGTLQRGQAIKIVDSELVPNNHLINDTINMNELPSADIDSIELMGLKGTVPVTVAYSGQLVLLKGISHLLKKSGTILSPTESDSTNLFKRIDYIDEPIFKIIIAPANPKELPKLLKGLSKINSYYPGVQINVEESGEHVILGFGELYLDCLLADLREVYANIEIKVSNPLTIFAEGCSQESFAAIPVESPNGAISVTIGARPLSSKLSRDLASGKLRLEAFPDSKRLSKALRTDYEWDSLAARNLWTFEGTNALVNDTLAEETDQDQLLSCKTQLMKGFYWATREGPLADERIHGVQYNILSFKINSSEEINTLHLEAQLIPLMRRACCVALMTANPILYEPIYEVAILTKSALLPIIMEVVHKRRAGKCVRTSHIAGSPFSEVIATIPVIDSVGFETDLRVATRGGAMSQSYFWNKQWHKVPGNVMDSDAVIPKLEPAPLESLSRDFVMKTRRRKGLSEEGFMSNDGPTLAKYIDQEMYTELKESGYI